MRPSQCIDLTADALVAGQPVWWHGPPGVGKTESADAVAMRISEIYGMTLGYGEGNWECPVWKFPPAVALEAVDVRGLPFNDQGRTGWLPPKFWPMEPDWKGIVFLDELPQGDAAVVNAFSQAVQSYHIGMDVILPRGIMWLAAGNRLEDRAGVKRVGSQMNSRFLHLDFEVSNDDWQAWAQQKRVRPEVRGFLNFRPAFLHQHNPAANERTSCNPRAWFNVHRLLEHLRPQHVHMGVAGLVGEGPAAEFAAFLEVYRDLPDLDTVLAKPATCTLPESNPMVMYALSTALSEKSKALDNLDNLATLGQRFKQEFSALCLRDTFAANAIRQPGGGLKAPPKLYKGKMQKWVAQHRDVLVPEAMK